jgi:hypothetical protein
MIRTQGEIAKGGTDLIKLAPWLAIAAIVTIPLLMKGGRN